MSIERTSAGFFESKAEPRIGRPHCIGIESGRVEECLRRYDEAEMLGFFGCPNFGFHEENFDFLKRVTRKPLRLWFWDVNVKNIDALYELKELDEFGINPKRPGIDFSRFSRLGLVVNHWLKQDMGLTEAAIQEYNLWHFKPRSKSFSDLEVPLNVEKLELNWANPANLSGLPVLKGLTELQIHQCRNLADLTELPRVAPNLRRLVATTSSRLDGRNGVIDHPELKVALINGKNLLPPSK